VFQNPGDSSVDAWNGAATSCEPTPEFAAEVADQVRQMLHDLPDDILRELAMLKLAGCTNQEAADRLGCSERSVKRKLMVIRTIWSEHRRDGA
jgi:DNA-directed RNA polymerase specialized sigma24 family protein